MWILHLDCIWHGQYPHISYQGNSNNFKWGYFYLEQFQAKFTSETVFIWPAEFEVNLLWSTCQSSSPNLFFCLLLSQCHTYTSKIVSWTPQFRHYLTIPHMPSIEQSPLYNNLWKSKISWSIFHSNQVNWRQVAFTVLSRTAQGRMLSAVKDTVKFL